MTPQPQQIGEGTTVKKLFTSTAVIVSLLTGNVAQAYDLSKVSDENKVAMLAGITVHAEMCGKPQSATVQTIRDQLKDDDDINMGDVRVKAADYTVEAALDAGAWCAKADKYLAGFERPQTTPVAQTPEAPAPLALTKDGLPDYRDKGYTCDKATIEREMAEMVRNSGAGINYGARLLYIKGEPVETLRVTEELRCRVTVKTSYSTYRGVFRFMVEEGHLLVGFANGKTK
jgi:hypothetical protein